MKTFLFIYHFKFIISRNINQQFKETIELFFDEHLQEFRQRLFQVLFIIALNVLLSFLNIQSIVKLLEFPVKGIHFFQSSPGEYFITTLTISWYAGLLFSIPLVLSQFIFFLVPGLSEREKLLVSGLLISSILLFFLGLFFSFFVLTPAALQFFINYSYPVLEPLLSFNEYFSFVSVLFFTTGLVFQVPIVQVVLSLIKILKPKQMLMAWRYILILSTIVGAILTPSADPLTQLLLSIALFALYLSGSFASKLIVENKITH